MSEIGGFFLGFTFLLALTVFLLLSFELTITTAEAVVGDIGVDSVLIEKFVVLLIGEAGIGRELGAFLREDVVFNSQPFKPFFYGVNNRL